MTINELDEILSTLYDYEFVDMDKFYSYPETQELLDIIEGKASNFEEKKEALQDMEEHLQGFLNFETNYNLKLGDLGVKFNDEHEKFLNCFGSFKKELDT